MDKKVLKTFMFKHSIGGDSIYLAQVKALYKNYLLFIITGAIRKPPGSGISFGSTRMYISCTFHNARAEINKLTCSLTHCNTMCHQAADRPAVPVRLNYV